MAASINDKFTETTNGSRPVPTTLTAILGSGASPGTATCGALTGWPTATAVHFIIYNIDVNGKKVTGSQTDWKGIVSGNTLTGLTLKAGTNNGYSIGAVVEAAPTAAWADDLTEGLLLEHNQDGTHAAITATSVATDTITEDTAAAGVTIDSLKIKDGGVADTNGNEVIKIGTTASAVNEVTVTNAATTGAPQISASGDDSNIDLRLVPKGNGNVKRGATGGSIDWWEEIGRTTLSGAGDTITVSSLPARKYLRVLVFAIATGGTISSSVTFNGDSGSNYARRVSDNGGADAATTSQGGLFGFTGTAAANQYAVLDIINVSNQEKLVIGHAVGANTAGAGNAPVRNETIGKWANTSAQINSITFTNGGSGDYAAGSEIIVLGHD